MKFADFVSAEAIKAGLEADTKERVIEELVKSLVAAQQIAEEDVDSILKAIMKREELGSTGIGRGVAVPHTKHPSVDRLVGNLCGGDFDHRIACLDQLKRSFAEEFNFNAVTRKQLGTRLREKRAAIDAVLRGKIETQSPIGHALAALETRGQRIAEPVAALRALAEDGALAVPLSDLASSLAHMSVNRLIAAEARAHEAVLYDFAHRDLLSQRARRRAQAGQPRPRRRRSSSGARA